MFFAHDLLVGPKGKFTMIWRAAVKKEKLKRRQLDTLDVSEVCKALIHYIKPRGDSRMGSITGFSLRLSAQLVYGVIVCYNWKVSYVLDDAISSWKAVIITKRLLQDLTLPKERKNKSRTANEKLQLDIRFDADPMFGETYGGDLEILPHLPPQTTSEESTSSSSSDRKKRRARSIHAVTDVSEITMAEDVPTVRETGDIIFNAEVAPFDLEELANMENQEVGFLDTILPKITQIVQPQPTTPVEAVLTDTPVMPRPPKRRRTEKRPDESILAVPLPEDAPAVEPSPLTLEPMDMYELPRRKHKKPRILIIDSRIERSAAEIKKQLAIRHRTIQDYREEGLLDEPLNLVPVDVLFSVPALQSSGFDTSRVETVRDVPSEDRSIIRNMFNCTIENISGFSTHDVNFRERSYGQLQADEPSIQAPRDVSNIAERLEGSMLPIEESLLLPEHSITRERRRASSRSRVSGLQANEISSIDVPAALDEQNINAHITPVDFPEPPPTDLELLPILEDNIYAKDGSVLDDVQKLWNTHGRITTFSSLAPPGLMSKSQAAKTFYSLLVHVKAGRVQLSQDHGFSEIVISMP